MNVQEIKQKYLGDKSLLELSMSNDPKDKKLLNKFSSKESREKAINRSFDKDNKVKRLMHEYMAKETQNAIAEIKKVRNRAEAKLKAYEQNNAIITAAKNAEASCNTLLSLINQNLKSIG